MEVLEDIARGAGIIPVFNTDHSKAKEFGHNPYGFGFIHLLFQTPGQQSSLGGVYVLGRITSEKGAYHFPERWKPYILGGKKINVFVLLSDALLQYCCACV